MKKNLLIVWLLITFFGGVIAQEITLTQKILPEGLVNKNETDYYGNSVAMDGNYAVVGATGYNLGTGCAYVLYYDGNQWLTQAMLMASDGEEDDAFGKSVAISGNTIVVGASGEDDGGYSQGAAYVFTMPFAGWQDMTETAKLKPYNGTSSQYFGRSVAIKGDKIVVGAPSSSSSSGSAYVFTRPAEGWVDMSQSTKLMLSNGNTGYYLGEHVAMSDEYIVVASEKGGAYIFPVPNGQGFVFQIAKLTSTSNYGSGIGSSVSIHNDCIVLGAKLDNTKGTSSGSASVYIKPDTGWEDMDETVKLFAEDSGADQYFGTSVFACENYIAIGSVAKKDVGSVYLFTKQRAEWSSLSQSAKLQPTDGIREYGYGNRFGSCIALSNEQLLAGASQDITNGGGAGAAYAYKMPAEGWNAMDETQKVLAPVYKNNEEDFFGSVIDMDGEYAVIGVPDHLDNTGCVYVLHLQNDSWRKVAILTASDPQTNVGFGCSVAINGDNIVVGSMYDTGYSYNLKQGKAYVFTKPESGWTDMTQTAMLLPSDPSTAYFFGSDVDIDGNNIVIGAFNDVWYQTGKVYVYTKPTNGWVDNLETAKLSPSSNTEYDEFGKCVAISDDIIVVGAPNRNSKRGKAYVYSKPESGWVNTTESATLKNIYVWSSFGISLSAHNNQVVVGGYFLYNKPQEGWTGDINAILISSDGTYNTSRSILNISDNYMVVGDENDENGSVHIFKKVINESTYSWDLMQKVENVNSKSEDFFGCGVGVSGDYLLVGAKGEDEKGWQSGAVYSYKITNTSTDVENEIKSDLMIYPNPTSGVIYVKLKDDISHKVTVYDISGKLLKEIYSSSIIEVIDLKEFENGVYIVSVENKSVVTMKKIIKK